MAKLKKNELKAMTLQDLAKRKVELNMELMKLKSQVARGTPPENPGRIRAIRKTIARILTIQNGKKEVTSK
jgi:large subunit ribosomal protein L29